MLSVEKYPLLVQKELEAWLKAPIAERIKTEIRSMISQKSPEIVDCFCKKLSFGTSGLRALMGPGPNRINEVTIAWASEAVCRYLLSKGQEGLSVAICYDNRCDSFELAWIAARVFAAHGIVCYIVRELRPVPYLSFLVRHLRTSAGIMVTASHNPKEYNGYKVYGSDGGEIANEREKKIEAIFRSLSDFCDVKSAQPDSSLIKELDLASMDEAYLKALDGLACFPKENKGSGRSLSIIYSSLHGTGATLALSALNRWGFCKVAKVEGECIVDKKFGSIKHPNPEEREVYSEGLKLLEKSNGDIFLVNDGDADRVGLALIHRGQQRILNGNEIAALCLFHLCRSLKEKKKLPSHAAMITTLVTTKLLDKIALSFGVAPFRVHVGFKFIAERIDRWEKEGHDLQFIFAAEESYGCLIGNYVRDKDGIAAACFLAEIALWAKCNGHDLVDLLNSIYLQYGVYRGLQRSVIFPPTEEGIATCKAVMAKVRESPPTALGGLKIVVMKDYLSGQGIDNKGVYENLSLERSDVLLFELENGGQLVLRPSGTEPKLRVHLELCMNKADDPQMESQALEEKLNDLMREIETYLLA